ncbi:MAG: flagellar basal body-associated FliL family protein [Deltaproteobacteria bacterium]|jgi:flagellar FliL protein|nr:flagellar basal body-associated FliL family protein [Deltaproteobacteria bacterium]
MSEKKKPNEPQAKAQAANKDHGAANPPPKSGLGKILVIALVAMAIGGAGAFALLKTVFAPTDGAAPVAQAPVDTAASQVEEEEPIVAPTKGGSEVGSPSASATGHGAAAEGAPAAPVGPITVELKPFTTNLNEPSGRRFLKVTIGMEVDNQEAVDELNKKMSDIQDSVLILLSSQSLEDIHNVDGKERLRGQILNRTNSYMTKNKVKKIKYSDFIIQ